MADIALQPFGRALHELLADREDFKTRTGNINWQLVAKALKGVHYESLRKSVAGERQPSVSLMEQVAELTGVKADYFVEYELAEAQRAFDVREVGFEQARENLLRWHEKRGR